MAYSVINGLIMSVLFIIYNPLSFIRVFLSVIIMFIIMSIVGKGTKKDLTVIAPYLNFGLIGLGVALVLNMFIYVSIIDISLSVFGVILFLSLTIYNIPKMKLIAEEYPVDSDMSKQMTIISALSLSLSFVNVLLTGLRLKKKWNYQNI